MIWLSALLIGVPGLLGYGVKHLRQPGERFAKEEMDNGPT